MAVRTIEARAIISAQDRTGGVFAGIAARLKALGRAAMGTEARIGSASAVAGRARAAQRVQAAATFSGAIAARNRTRGGAILGRNVGNIVSAAEDGLGLRGGALTVGGAAVGAGLITAKTVGMFADAERKMTRIGLTANASRQEMKAAMADAQTLAKDVALPFGSIVEGMSALATQGMGLKEVRELIPSIARTAQAAGAEVEDIAKTAETVGTNFKVAGSEMQEAFDIMAAGGKAGQFELKDMARYLPSLGPAASAIGFEGKKGLADLVAMLQVMRKGSGSAEEAVSSMNNILAKMESDKTTKAFKELGVDSAAAFKKARQEGGNLVEVFEQLLNKALKGDRSRIGEIIDDMEFKRGAQALMTYRGEWQKLSAEMLRTAPGTVMRDLKVVLADTQAPIDQLSESFAGAARSIGSLIATGTPLIGMLKATGRAADELSEAIKKVKIPKSEPDDLYKELGVIPGVPSGSGKAVLDKMAKEYAKQQAREQNLEGGGQSYGGVAFGAGLDFGKKGGDTGKRVGGTYRNSPYAWGTGYDANAPLPPSKPGFLGGAMPASTSKEINDAISGRTIPDEMKNGPLSRIPPIAPPRDSVAPAGKVEAVVTAPITAQLIGSAPVTGTGEIKVVVEAGSSLLAIQRTVEHLSMKIQGTLNAGSNGPGSSGRSSPDAGAGNTGAQ